MQKESGNELDKDASWKIQTWDELLNFMTFMIPLRWKFYVYLIITSPTEKAREFL